MTTAYREFLRRYLGTHAPVSQEGEGQKVWIDYIKPYVDQIESDHYQNAIATINPGAPYKVVIEAHADEISWYINYINEKGYIYVIRNGGSDYQIAPSMRALIHLDNGKKHSAIFGWPAIHTRRGAKSDPKPNIETIILDGGFSSKKEVEEAGIHVGHIVTFDQAPQLINNKYWTGKALDNKIGGYAIARVAEKLYREKQKLPFSLHIVNAVQEEIGLRGASMIAKKLNPDIAIITDVTHDTQSPLYNPKKEGLIACEKGPVIYYAPSIHPSIREIALQAAQKNKIPFQRAAASTSTGTDADAFAYATTGTPTLLISTPLKYMHTTVEMVAEQDVEHLVNLIYHTLCRIDGKGIGKNTM